jgi:hypothetical protein
MNANSKKSSGQVLIVFFNGLGLRALSKTLFAQNALNFNPESDSIGILSGSHLG